MSVCPRCYYEFFADPKPRSVTPKPADAIYAHLCSTGYIRPYPQRFCSTCKHVGDDNTELMSLDLIDKTNKVKKIAYFREREKNQEPEAELVHW